MQSVRRVKFLFLLSVEICAVICFVFLSQKPHWIQLYPGLYSWLTLITGTIYNLIYFFFKGEIWFKRRLISTSLQWCISVKTPSIVIWSMYYLALWNCTAIHSRMKLAELIRFINICPRVWVFFLPDLPMNQWSVIYHGLIVIVEFGISFSLVVGSAPWKKDSLESAFPN